MLALKKYRFWLILALSLGLTAATVLYGLIKEPWSAPLGQEQRLHTYLAPRLLEELRDFEGKIGIAIYDLNKQEAIYINENEVFPAASLIKIPIMLELYTQVQDGRISLEQLVTYNAQDQTGGFGQLQRYPPGTRFKIRQLLEWMIAISDNDATHVLYRVLRPETINRGLRDQGFKVTELRSHLPATYPQAQRRNLTTPLEMLQLFRSIFDQKRYTKNNSQEMLQILQQQALNEELPRYLPKGTNIGHKTGLLEGVVHDAGIVLLFGRSYIICLLSEARLPLAEQTRSLGRISRTVYNFFSYNRGPFLLGAGGSKKPMGVLLLAGQSYSTGQMKDLAEYLHGRGVAVYCLPLVRDKQRSFSESLPSELEHVQRGLGLLQNYSQRQYVIASGLDGLSLLSSRKLGPIAGLVLIPDIYEKRFVRWSKWPKVWLLEQLARLHRPKGRFLSQVIYFDQLKAQVLQDKRTFRMPVYLMVSPELYQWCKPLCHPPQLRYTKPLPPFERWTMYEYTKLYAFLSLVEKEKRR